MAFPFLRKRNGEGSDNGANAFQTLVEAVFDGVIALDGEGTISWVDPGFCRLTAFPAGEIEGQPLVSLIDPGDAERLQDYLGRAASEPQVFDLHLIDGTGSIQILRLHAAGYQGEGGVTLLVGVQDVSDEESLRRRLVFTEKIDLLNRLMNGVAADLRSALETLSSLVEQSGDAEAAGAFQRLSDLEHRVDLFPRRGIRDGRELAVPELIARVVESLEDDPDLAGDLVETRIEGEPYPVFGDADQLEEAFRQVLRNARQAAGSTGGEVKVVVSTEEVKRARPRRGFLLPPGQYAHITVSDNGPGMPPEILDHVFEPLFTTRGGNPLAGLGLAVAYTVLKNHRGYIGIESEPGSGTTVELFLPRSRVARTRPAPVKETAGPAAATAPETVPAEAAADPAAGKVVTEAAEIPVEEETVPEVKAPRETAAAEEPVSIADEEPVADLPEPSPEAIEEVFETPAEATEKESEEEVAVELEEGEAARLSGHETVLIVIEDLKERERAEDVIERFGYNALPSRNWVEGIDLYKRHARVVDLVLLDITMPEMTWVKTLIEVQRVDPGVLLVLLGEPTPGPTARRYLGTPTVSLVERPLNAPALLRGLRSALDGKASED